MSLNNYYNRVKPFGRIPVVAEGNISGNSVVLNNSFIDQFNFNQSNVSGTVRRFKIVDGKIKLVYIELTNVTSGSNTPSGPVNIALPFQINNPRVSYSIFPTWQPQITGIASTTSQLIISFAITNINIPVFSISVLGVE
jgi:hypothetical protein